MNILPEKIYSLNEIIRLGLIPGVNSYNVVYTMVSKLEKTEDKKRPVLVSETTKDRIKPEILKQRPGLQQRGRLGVKGSEIIKFLKLNNL